MWHWSLLSVGLWNIGRHLCLLACFHSSYVLGDMFNLTLCVLESLIFEIWMLFA